MAATSLYPVSVKEDLVKQFVGRSIKDVGTPVAVLDISKLENNCNRMLEACASLEFEWRAHIKTHKTIELTRLQVGSGTGPVNLIVSTLIEAEFILPLLLEYKSQGRAVNLLYSFPITPSAVSRLSHISKSLGPHGLSVMVDNTDQIPFIEALRDQSGVPPSVFLKIDLEGHRAGVKPLSQQCILLISSLLNLSSTTVPTCHFLGLYSHAGHSYSSDSRASALQFLRQEFETLLLTAKAVHSTSSEKAISPTTPLVLSVGATPTTTSVRNLLVQDSSRSEEEAQAVAALRATISSIRDAGCKIEIHAGVYPTLDLQQLATHALPTEGPHAMLTWSDLAFTVVAEVASFYPGRGKNGTPEVLIAAGCLALGREPCKAYPGWGMLTPWNRPGVQMPAGGPEKFEGWFVDRVSQEHGILAFNGPSGSEDKLLVGQKVRIWPNHACITGAGFGYYLVVDERRAGREDEIIDVWVRCRGW